GRGAQQGVEAVHDPAVAGQQVAHVLDADVPLEQGLAEVTDGRGADDREPEENALPDVSVQREPYDDAGHRAAGDRRAGEALPGLARRDRRRELVPPAGEHTGRVAADVTGDNGA